MYVHMNASMDIIYMYVYDDHMYAGVCRNRLHFPTCNTMMTTTLTLSLKWASKVRQIIQVITLLSIILTS